MPAPFRLALQPAAVLVALGIGALPARAAPIDDCAKGRGASALSLCSQIITDEKEKPATRAYARLLRARAAMDMSDLDRAEEDISAAIAAAPNNTFAYRLRARLRTLQGREADARADHNKSVDMPQSPVSKYTSHVDRGHFLIRSMELKEARDDFDAAIRLDPAKALAYVGRAIAHKSGGDMANALADLDRAKAVDPDYRQTYNERGEILMAEKRYAEAIADFDRALALEPRDARAQRGRTAAAALAKASGSAVPPPRPAVAAPATPPAGQPKVTAPAATPSATPPVSPPPAPATAAPAAPPSPPAAPPATATPATPPSPATPAVPDARRDKMRQAMTLRQTNKHREALVIYDELLRTAPADPELSLEKGRTLVSLERWKDSIDTLKLVIDNKSAHVLLKALAFEAQSEVLARNNQYEAAVLSATAGLQINPKMVTASYWRGFSQYNLGAYETAVADFQESGKILPQSPLYPAWEALALVGTGDLTKARAAIDRSFSLAADNTFALTARARLRLAAGELDGVEADLASLQRRGPLGPVSLQTQQFVMINKLLKPTDGPSAATKQ